MPLPGFVVQAIRELPVPDLLVMIEESERQGFAFVRRLLDQWHSGVKRFDGPGERLFGAFAGPGRAVGICGLTRDPFTEAPGVGRLRNLYVLAEFRRAGIGTALVRTVIAAARPAFDLLRLRAGSPEAARLYERHGFARAPAGVADCTHLLDLAGG